jgi:hypothetical protein
MRIGWLGLVGVLALMASCKEDPATPPPPPPPDPPKFRVGGTLSGLSGSITLQLNGAESLTRTENGPFTFQAQLEDQGDYAVTIATPPVEQDCTLQDARGKVNAADVASVKVSCVQRTYSISGMAVGVTGQLQLQLNGGEVISVTQDGGFTFQTPLPKNERYTVTVSASPEDHRCLASNNSGTVGGNVTGITVRCYRWFDLTSFQTATRVLGQGDFFSYDPHRGDVPAADTFGAPWGNPVLAGGRLYVSDLQANRILGFDGIPTLNGASAAFVLGQPNFTSTAEGAGRAEFAGPEGTSSDGTRLAIADKNNSRVVLYAALPTSTGAQADRVVGQPDFGTSTEGCDAQTLNFPEDVFIGHSKLIVADSGNHRVMVWNSVPTTNGARADLVLGQGSFTTCAPNDRNGDGNGDGAPTASTLFAPGGVWTDGTRLLIADAGNHRLLLWDRFPTTSGQPADWVLGQPDFTSQASATSDRGMNAPAAVTSTGLQIFAAERQNNRVLVWNQFPATNGLAADTVLGQPDFTSTERFDPPTGTTTSARSLFQPTGVHLAWPSVIVKDYGNRRVLVFTSR